MTSKRKSNRPAIARRAARTADTAVKAARRNLWSSAALLAGIGAIGGFLLTRGRGGGASDVDRTDFDAGRPAADSGSRDTDATAGSGQHSVTDTAPGPAISPIAIAAAEGHPVADLARDDRPGPSDRADPHFRPDMDAPMDVQDRAALTPPTIPQAS